DRPEPGRSVSDSLSGLQFPSTRIESFLPAV
ncbi:hypothetical protein DBR06_SOUSAS27110016, partial [Sousa chinensis]